MSYREYNTRGTRSRLPAHRRFRDAIRDLHERYRLGWLFLFLAVILAASHLLRPTPPIETADALFGAGETAYWRHLEEILEQLELPRVADADDLRVALAEQRQDRFQALTAVAGLGDKVLISSPADRIRSDDANEEKVRAFGFFRDGYAAARDRYARAMLEEYARTREKTLASPSPASTRVLLAHGLGLDLADMLPDLPTPEFMMERLHLPELYLLDKSGDGVAYLILSFSPEWTTEAFGIILHRDSIVAAGYYGDELGGLLESAGQPPESEEER